MYVNLLTLLQYNIRWIHNICIKTVFIFLYILGLKKKDVHVRRLVLDIQIYIIFINIYILLLCVLE